MRVVIRANESHKSYLKSLPLHHSQKLLAEKDDYADFELHIAPTYDFIMRLFQMGYLVEVISPASLRATMKEWSSKIYGLYRTNKCPKPYK